MKMEVGIVSEEYIKPSSSTPSHLRNFKLSLLDQLIPVPYAPMVFFYNDCPNPNLLSDIPKRLELLKESLSETLTQFYPLAGKIKDDLHIECNDEGAYFVEAQVNCRLDEFLSKPDVLLLNQFLPCGLILKESVGSYVTNIQVNVFKCGGIAIGLCISHKILDGAALDTFLKAWSGAARGSGEKVYPNFDATSLFRTNDLSLRDSAVGMWGVMLKNGKPITRRFLFDASAIATLKSQATTSSCVRQPTRVEVVSGFIWKHLMSASAEEHGFKKPSLLTHVVNLRKRMALPLIEYTLGNLIWIAAGKCMAKDEVGLQDLVGELRVAISRIDGDFVKKIQGEERNSFVCQFFNEISEVGSKQAVDFFGFSSWCNIGFYETDFGWGKPIWVSSIGSSGSVFLNLIVLVDTQLGDGVEAWLTLDEQEMARLESNAELLTFASVDPSPL